MKQGIAVVAAALMLLTAAPAQAAPTGSVPAAVPAESTSPLVTCSPEEVRATQRWWFFGNSVRADFGVSGTAAPVFSNSGVTYTPEGSTVVTDTRGALRFWSNGELIYDSKGDIMPNSNGLGGTPSATQIASAFPVMGDPGMYYVVVTDYAGEQGRAPRLHYSMVDMKLRGGLGDVVPGKKNILLDLGYAGESLIAVPNADGDGFWAITHAVGQNKMIAYEMTRDGVGAPVISTMSGTRWAEFQTYSSLSANKQMNRLVLTNTGPYGGGLVTLFDFNARSGQLTQKFTAPGPTRANTSTSVYSSAFSPNGDYLYVSTIYGATNGIWQHNANATTADEFTKSAVDKFKQADNDRVGGFGGALQLGPDGNIYYSNYNPNNTQGYLGRITNPDSASSSVNAKAVTLPAGTSTYFGLPQLVAGCEKSEPKVEASAWLSQGTYKVGDQVNASYRIVNRGNTRLKNLGHSFELKHSSNGSSGTTGAALDCGPFNAADTVLEVGGSVTCTGTVTATQAMVDATETVFTASTSIMGILERSGIPDVPLSATASATMSPVPNNENLAVALDADKASYSTVGEPVTYTYTVKNTGAKTLHGLDLTRTAGGSWTDCTVPDTLAPGAAFTCVYVHTVTQEDLEAGSIEASGKVRGTSVTTGAVELTRDANTVKVPAVQRPALELSGDTQLPPFALGQSVTFPFTVTNTGNMTVSGVAMRAAEFSVPGELPRLDCASEALAPGGTMECLTAHVVTQADLDRGSISLSALAEGKAQREGAVVKVSTGLSNRTASGEKAPALSTVTTVDSSSFVAGGQLVFTTTVTNTGNLTVSDPFVTVTGFTGTGHPSPVECEGVESLAPGASMTCTTSYVTVQADVDASSDIELSATAAAVDPWGAGVASQTSSAKSSPVRTTGLELTAAADAAELTVGTGLGYTFRVTNTGTVTAEKVSINQLGFDGTGRLGAVECGQTELAPGGSIDCTAGYTVTQKDFDRGSLFLEVTAGALPRGSAEPVESTSVRVDTEAVWAPTLALGVSVDRRSFAVGTMMRYSMAVANTGNTTLDDVHVEPLVFTGTGILEDVECDAEADSFAPGDEMSCATTYTATQADVDKATIGAEFVALGTMNGGASKGPEVSGIQARSVMEAVVTESAALPALEVKQTVSSETYELGQELTYGFTAENTGNVTLSGVAVDRTVFSGSGEAGPAECGSNTLLVPGQLLECSAKYPVTQADVDAGKITSEIAASGTAPDGSGIKSGAGMATSRSLQSAVLSVKQTAEVRDGGAVDRFKAGEQVTYSFAVKNLGTVTAHAVEMEGTEFTGSGALGNLECDAETGDSLAPGKTLSCTAPYTATEADVDRGSLSNTAVAHGKSPAGEDVSSDPSTAVLKAADPVVETTAPGEPQAPLVEAAAPVEPPAPVETKVAVTGEAVVSRTAGWIVGGLVLLGLGLAAGAVLIRRSRIGTGS